MVVLKKVKISFKSFSKAKLWDISNCELIFTLVSHKEAVFCVDMQGDIIATGSADRTVKIWNKLTGLCLKTFHLESNFSIISLSMDKSYIVCSSNSLIMLIKYDKQKNVYSFRKFLEFKEHFRRFVYYFYNILKF